MQQQTLVQVVEVEAFPETPGTPPAVPEVLVL
jgi:hypothetical protein